MEMSRGLQAPAAARLGRLGPASQLYGAALIVGALFGEETLRFAALLWQTVRAG